MEKEKRFTTIYAQDNSLSKNGQKEIFVDTETGVHYLMCMKGNAGGLTPLLDSEGKPVVSKE